MYEQYDTTTSKHGISIFSLTYIYVLCMTSKCILRRQTLSTPTHFHTQHSNCTTFHIYLRLFRNRPQKLFFHLGSKTNNILLSHQLPDILALSCSRGIHRKKGVTYIICMDSLTRSLGGRSSRHKSCSMGSQLQVDYQHSPLLVHLGHPVGKCCCEGHILRVAFLPSVH